MRTIGLTIDAADEKSAEPLICPHCGKEHKTAAALKTHCKKEHPDAFDTTDD